MFAYKFMEGVLANEGTKDSVTICFKDVKRLVSLEYERLEAFHKTGFCRFMAFSEMEQGKR